MNSSNLHQSPLIDLYPDDPPLMPFGGWEMPRDFGGIVQEHLTVREDCGIFDLSHMGRLVFKGKNALNEIDQLFTRSCEAASNGRALYGFFCDENGGCLDDAILYRKSDTEVWMVVNAANRERIIDWIKNHTTTPLEDRTFETVLLAVQGPNAPEILDQFDSPDFPDKPFKTLWQEDAMTATTGYTGEPGGELWLNRDVGRKLFEAMIENDLTPCGLGARDTLRLEKAFPLHGHELSKDLDPVTAGFEQFIEWDHDFIGRDVLKQKKENGPEEEIIGLRTGTRQSPREGYRLRTEDGNEIGSVTSGGYSPILEEGIGMAKIESGRRDDEALQMNIRNDWRDVKRTSLPFV
jgi:aminomethyltransferase